MTKEQTDAFQAAHAATEAYRFLLTSKATQEQLDAACARCAATSAALLAVWDVAH